MEKRRAGLNASLRLWIVLDEYNQDVIGQSFYLEPDSQLGHFSKAFFLPLMKEFIARRASVLGLPGKDGGSFQLSFEPVFRPVRPRAGRAFFSDGDASFVCPARKSRTFF